MLVERQLARLMTSPAFAVSAATSRWPWLAALAVWLLPDWVGKWKRVRLSGSIQGRAYNERQKLDGRSG
jgi:hypothetical protein